MFFTLFKYILWQSRTKPTRLYNYLLSIFYWLLVLFFETIIIVGLYNLRNDFIKYPLMIWFLINNLFAGSTWENIFIFTLKLWFLGRFYAIKNAKSEKIRN